MKLQAERLFFVIGLPFFYLVFLMGKLIRRDDKIWVFGSWNGKRFADNSKWFYLYCNNGDDQGCRFIWISRDREIVNMLQKQGYSAFFLYSFQGIYYSLKAGVYIFDSFSRDVSYWFSNGAKKILLQHGVPIKKIGRDIDNTDSLFYKCFYGNFFERMGIRLLQPWWAEQYDLIPSTSEYCSKCFQTAFNVSKQKTPITGFPRNDAMIKGGIADKVSYSEDKGLIKSNYDNVVIYMPTFRDSQREKREIPIKWEKLESLFRKNNSLFCLKLHPNERFSFSFEKFSHIKILDPDIDIYPLFKNTDILITDYSSVSLDFMSIGRDIIFYTYDLKEYKEKDRSLYIELEEVIGQLPSAQNFNELYQLLKLKLKNASVSKSTILGADVRFHKYNDGKSSERVMAKIREHLGFD